MLSVLRDMTGIPSFMFATFEAYFHTSKGVLQYTHGVLQNLQWPGVIYNLVGVL